MLAALALGLSLAVTPRMCHDPCDVKITIRVEDATARDKVRIEVVSTEAYRSREVIMENRRRTYEQPFLQCRGEGVCYVVATLLRNGKTETVQHKVCVGSCEGNEP